MTPSRNTGDAQPAKVKRYANPAPPEGDTSRAGPIRHCAMSTIGTYQPSKDQLTPTVRPGADAAFSVPSRTGNQLHYRDGRMAAFTSEGNSHV